MSQSTRILVAEELLAKSFYEEEFCVEFHASAVCPTRVAFVAIEIVPPSQR